MRYRPEQLPNDDLVIRNVETDLILGLAIPGGVNDPHDPDRMTITMCRVLNREGREIATIGPWPGATVSPLEKAAIAVASHEESSGYPGFKAGAKNPEPLRIEHLLGTVLADAVSEIARGLIECGNGGLRPKTKRKCAELIAQLHAIWYASLFGSFNAERWAHEPYFANIPRCGPRLTFGEAAQVHGMFELRMRYPDVSDELLKLALSWPIELLERLANSLLQGDTTSALAS